MTRETTELPFDPRRTPVRSDLAAWQLRESVRAPRYVRGQDHRVRAELAQIYGEPGGGGPMLTEAIFGEVFTIYDTQEGWSWGQLQTDGYVGWLDSIALVPDLQSPTHRVRALCAHLYSEADLKAQAHQTLVINSRLTTTGTSESWYKTADGWVHQAHIEPVNAAAEDWVAIAEQLTGVPYLWGGRSCRGIDCSGLVQLALSMAGFSPPRDSDMQYAELGRTIDHGKMLQRGDLVFWKGHVGIMIDSAAFVHANAHHMAVAVEPLQAAEARIAETYGPIIGYKRIAIHD